jgi:16S rRNA (guanine527-N7)-methyltransferase
MPPRTSPPPDSARVVFGSALPLAEAYAALLAGPGVERGLIGPSEAARIWDRHLLNCAVVARMIPRSCVVADLGSGAGLPGLVLAMMRPLAQVVLIEPMARRTAFLAECIAELGLTNVTVRRARAEDLAGQIGADVVTARAVARLDRLAGIASGLARPGGLVLAIKGDAAAEELDQAKPVLDRLGATNVGVTSVGAGVICQPTTVIRFRTGGAAPRRRR